MDDGTSQPESNSNLSDTPVSSNTQEGSRKRKSSVKHSNNLAGKSRKVYKLSKELDKSLQESPGISGVCSSCASSLARIADGFKQLMCQRTELKKRKKSLPAQK